MLAFLFNSNFHRPSNTSLLRTEFFIGLNVLDFCAVLFCGLSFLQDLIFAGQGQSAKLSAKIKTRNFFIPHGI